MNGRFGAIRYALMSGLLVIASCHPPSGHRLSDRENPPTNRRPYPARPSAVERAGLRKLNEGQKVNYEIVADERTGKSSAGNLTVA
jgi:'Cold-shock' DNA-binding domain